MSKKLLLLIAAVLCVILSVSAFAADDTVYVDGTGATEGAHTTLQAAFTALADRGGNVIVCGNTTVGTSGAGITLPAAAGKVTVTGENGAVLTIARSLSLASEVEFDNITIHSTSSSVGNILCWGHKLTMGEGVTITKGSGAVELGLIGGGAGSALTADSHIVVLGGHYRAIFGGNFSSTFTGTSTIEVSGASTSGKISGINWQGTFNGTSTIIFDLRGGKTVKAGEYIGEPQLIVDDGYEGVLVDGTYMQQEIPVVPVPTTVYVDGTGATEGAHTTLEAAFEAIADRGGNVIVCGNTTVGTSGAGITLPAAAGKVTVTGENGAVLTIARSLSLASEVEFDNITINSTSTSIGNLLCWGHKLTMGEGVTITKGNGAVELGIFGGGAGSALTADSHIVVLGGHYRAIFGGNYSSTFTGTSTIEVSGASTSGKISGINWQGTFNGTSTIIFDLRGGKTVKAGEYIGEPQLIVDDGYEGVLVDGTYMQQEISEVPAPTTVYVDGTGKTEGAYTTFEDAFRALSSEGGTIVLKGDTQLGTTTKGVVLADYNNFKGGVTFTSENGAKLIFARSLRANCDITFDNIHIHSIIPSNLTANNNIIACGHTITVCDDVTTTKDDSAIWPAIVGGQDASTTYDTHIVVKAGTWQNIYAGGFSGTFTGKAVLEVTNVTVVGNLSASNRSGNFNGTSEMIFDLRGGKTVTAGTFVGTPICLADDGYEGVLVDGTYMQQEISTEPAPTVVYVDGTVQTSGDGLTAATAVKTLPEAATLLRNGGTIVVCGTVNVDSAITLYTRGELTITSVYGDEDYTDTAMIAVANNITLGTPLTFKDVTLDKAATGNDYIIANGNKLVIDEGVFCRNFLATNYISIIGGAYSGTFTGDSDVTVKSGYFRNIHGGNYNGTFKGNSTVNFLGGYVDNMVSGGSFQGNFEGDATVNMGGDAVIIYSSAGSGIVGSNCGAGSSQYTFVGDIYINLFGSARVNQSVYGTTRYSNVTTTGNVYITVKDDTYIDRALYAGGYAGTLNGNTSVIIDNGFVGTALTAASRDGAVNGNTYLEINGGQFNYYNANAAAGASSVAGTYNTAGGGLTGTVSGNTEVVINGGDINGNVYGGSLSTGAVGGNSTVTLTGGSVVCGVYADGQTAGTVAGTKSISIDLSKGGSLSLGLSVTVNSLVGGGKLVLFPGATVTADTFSGNVALEINGVPLARTYIDAASVDNATVTYSAYDTEKFVADGGKFGVSSEGYHETTKVVIKHVNGARVYMRATLVKDSTILEAASTTGTESTYNLVPGIYNYVVYHTQSDYKRKYLYITGKEEEIVLDFTYYTPKSGEGIETSTSAENTNEIYDKYYNTDDLVGYKTPDSPYFNKDRVGKRAFTTNEEMYEFVQSKAASCSYAYAFDLFTSPGGYTSPVVVFTKDEIPENATLDDVAEIVSSTYGRDILMVVAFVHGNEPSGGEGALAMISEMCGEYGDNLLTGNVGAVIIVPRLNPDGAKAFTRNSPTATVIKNLNRDYAYLSSVEISAVAKVFDIFAPTVFLDLHEAFLAPKWSESYTLTDIYDVGIVTSATTNTSLVNVDAVLRGDYQNRGSVTQDFITEAMKGIEETGLRSFYYTPTGSAPAPSNDYSNTKGALGMTIEVAGMDASDAAFGRRVFAQVTAVKEVFELIKESDGGWAKVILDSREKTALSAQKFDPNTPIVLQSSYTRHDSATLLWNNPILAADAVMRKEDNVTKFFYQDVAVKYRSRPTAYVISADTAGIDNVLGLLDKHGIDYFLLEDGTTLNLKQYSGNSTSSTLSAAKDVTFENGAYIVPLDGYDAYLIAILFEPEYPDSSDTTVTLVEMEYLTAADIYRSEESFIAAKLGLEGTYKEVDVPEGKTVASAVVNGVVYDNVDTVGDKAYVVAASGKDYVITLNFTDGTSETVGVGIIKGDIDGDGTVTVMDVLMLIRAVVNDQTVENGDLNGDGEVSLIDVLRVMKLSAQ